MLYLYLTLVYSNYIAACHHWHACHRFAIPALHQRGSLNILKDVKDVRYTTNDFTCFPQLSEKLILWQWDTLVILWHLVSSMVREGVTKLISVLQLLFAFQDHESSSDDGIHEESRELLKYCRQPYSDFSIFIENLSTYSQKVTFDEVELMKKTRNDQRNFISHIDIAMKISDFDIFDTNK